MSDEVKPSLQRGNEVRHGRTRLNRILKGNLSLPTGDPSPGSPGWLERASCIIVGIIAGGAGGYVAFERSNQLGSAVLLVIGALFLVIGIQGTRLMRFTSGSNIVELEQKQRTIVEAIEKAQDEGNLQKASGIAEGASIAAPFLGIESRGLLYEIQVSSAIASMGYFVANVSGPGDMGVDLRIRNDTGREIHAQLKRYSRSLPRAAVEILAAQASRSHTPLVLITYTELTRGAQEVVKSSRNLEAVQWSGEHDNALLARTLRRMFASMPSTVADD